jgi:hypothetical protein
MFLGMSRVGWSAKSSPEERAEVIRLAAEEVSVRRIAAEVFGDSRYRGRVERILRRPAVGVRPTVTAEGETEIDLEQLLASGGQAGVVPFLLARYERWLITSGTLPSLAEMERLLRIRRQLAGFAELERLRALHARSRA